MRLRRGVTVEQAVKALEGQISDSQRASAQNASGAEVKRQAYLNWVSTTQQQLRTIFADTELEDSLLGRGYWHICALSSQSSEKLLNRLIGEELVFQVGHPGIQSDPGGRIGEAAPASALASQNPTNPVNPTNRSWCAHQHMRITRHNDAGQLRKRPGLPVQPFRPGRTGVRGEPWHGIFGPREQHCGGCPVRRGLLLARPFEG